MTIQELEKINIVRDGMFFTPRYDYIEIEILNEETGEKEKVFDYTITAIAEQVYQEYLAQKNAPTPLTTEQILEINITDIEISNIKRDRQLTDLEIACMKKGVVI